MLKQKILITGGAGFIGSALVRLLCKIYPKDLSLIVVDKLTYAGDLTRLKQLQKKFKFYRADISDRKEMESIFRKEKPEVIFNFAAETHVDRSIINALPFIETNIKGVQVLLELSRKYKIKKFIQISTDEVYGEIKRGSFSENSPLRPNSPYAASKAAADLLIKAYIRTYNFPAIIIRPCNNYGPWQYPEKLIPLAILKILKNEKIPIYGKGENIREWLYVDDCAEAILEIFKKGKIGQVYNLGGGKEIKNIKLVRLILELLNAPRDLICFVKDRPGHDIRYRLNFRKVSEEIGWRPKTGFEDGIRSTVDWYIRHKSWLLKK